MFILGFIKTLYLRDCKRARSVEIIQKRPFSLLKITRTGARTDVVNVADVDARRTTPPDTVPVIGTHPRGQLAQRALVTPWTVAIRPCHLKEELHLPT